MASARRNRAGKTSSEAYALDPRCRLLQWFDVCFAVKTRSRLRCHVAKNGKDFPRLPSGMMSVSGASKASHPGSWLYWKFATRGTEPNRPCCNRGCEISSVSETEPWHQWRVIDGMVCVAPRIPSYEGHDASRIRWRKVGDIQYRRKSNIRSWCDRCVISRRQLMRGCERVNQHNGIPSAHTCCEPQRPPPERPLVYASSRRAMYLFSGYPRTVLLVDWLPKKQIEADPARAAGGACGVHNCSEV